ncbi:MAG: hypothetical protein ACP5E5_08945 [Acidobacteriaceae bacterium]
MTRLTDVLGHRTFKGIDFRHTPSGLRRHLDDVSLIAAQEFMLDSFRRRR